MEILLPILQHPFTWGLTLGLIFTVIVWWRLRSFKQAHTTQFELDAKSKRDMLNDLDRLRKENENLRIRVKDLQGKPGNREMRELQIHARTAQRMVISVPGFAQSWEIAKAEVAVELEEEDAGKRLPNRIFSWLGLSSSKKDALPES